MLYIIDYDRGIFLLIIIFRNVNSLDIFSILMIA